VQVRREIQLIFHQFVRQEVLFIEYRRRTELDPIVAVVRENKRRLKNISALHRIVKKLRFRGKLGEKEESLCKNAHKLRRRKTLPCRQATSVLGASQNLKVQRTHITLKRDQLLKKELFRRGWVTIRVDWGSPEASKNRVLTETFRGRSGDSPQLGEKLETGKKTGRESILTDANGRKGGGRKVDRGEERKKRTVKIFIE